MSHVRIVETEVEAEGKLVRGGDLVKIAWIENGEGSVVTAEREG